MLLSYNHNITDYHMLSHFSKKLCRPSSCNVYLTQLLKEEYTALKQWSKEIHFEELVFPSITFKDFVAASKKTEYYFLIAIISKLVKLLLNRMKDTSSEAEYFEVDL